LPMEEWATEGLKTEKRPRGAGVFAFVGSMASGGAGVLPGDRRISDREIPMSASSRSFRRASSRTLSL
jgi:hypothetical protein